MGTYSYAVFSRETKQALHSYTSKLSIPNAVRPDKFHVTVLYSNKTLEDYVPASVYNHELTATGVKFAVWPTNTTPCLVLILDCPDLVNHHLFLMKKYDAEYDFPEYIPHVTLSYDIGMYDVDILNKCIGCLPPLTIVGECAEMLDKDCNIKSCTINKTVDSFITSLV